MKYPITLLAVILLAINCQVKTQDQNGHTVENNGDVLTIKYKGDAEVVQFKMFEGLHVILKKENPSIFHNQLNIPDLDDAIFSYDIIVHKKDSTGKMTRVPYQSSDGERRFSWIGQNRNVPFTKAEEIKGVLKDTTFDSKFLMDKRQLTIYYPPTVSNETPIFYLTDGSVVKSYAEYVDQLINEKKIYPVILAGVHSSRENRYSEYVETGDEHFQKHKDFFFKEVMPGIENGIEKWNGKRYMYGFSNGAAFCMNAGINQPDHFEEIIAFSTADYISEFRGAIEFKFEGYPRFYMGAGRYEESIFRNNKTFIQKLENNNIDFQFKEFIAGHDSYVWRIEFLEFLAKKFEQ